MSTPVASFKVGILSQSGRGFCSVIYLVASGRTFPALQWLTHSDGLLTVESTCFPTSATHTSPPPLNGT